MMNKTPRAKLHYIAFMKKIEKMSHVAFMKTTKITKVNSFAKITFTS
jgi:hypothetical protein